MGAPAATPLLLAGGYLAGTFPTAVLVARSRGRDVTAEGSGNPGATNVYRIAGRGAAITVFVIDAAKGALVFLVAIALVSRGWALAAGAGAVVGHCFPVTRGFRGGKGVATAAGFLMVAEPPVGLAAPVVWFVLLKLTGRASVGSIVVAAGAPLAVLAWRGPHADAAAVAALAILVIARHATNIARLARGEEGAIRGRRSQ